jgi:hypothetical protein
MSTPSFAPSRQALVGRRALIIAAIILALAAAATVLALTAGTSTPSSPRVATTPSPATSAAAGHVTSALRTGTPFGGPR